MKNKTIPVFGKLSIAVSALSLAALAVVAALAMGAASPAGVNVSDRPIDRSGRLGISFAPVVKKVAPGVVNIYSTRTVRVQPFRNPFENNPFFRQFFGGGNPGGGRPLTERSQGLGSGAIVSEDGYILTANHVIDGADKDGVKVALADDKTQYPAKVIGTDPQTDVAVLKIDAKKLSPITLGDSDKLEVGDLVLAIGNPFRVGQSVTMGIVSAVGRGGFNMNGYENFIQTDAAINPGNSGGPLVDVEGRIVGINTFIESPSGANAGVGFAVPINMARQVMERLIAGGKVTRGYLGILPQDLTAAMVKQFNVPDQNGALVGDVVPNAPAAKAGIKTGDVIIEFDGKKISDSRNFKLAVSQTAPGTKVTVKLLRDGKERTVTATLGELPDEAQAGSSSGGGLREEKGSTTDGLDGVTVEDLTGRTRRQLDIPADVRGALVTQVDSGSNAAEAGLQQGDVIVEIERQPVRNAEDAVSLSEKAKGDQILLLVWSRTENLAGTHYVTVDNRKKQ